MDIQNKNLIIRHSIREPIKDAKDSMWQLLTEEGKELARTLGKKLAQHSPAFSIYHSPVERCRQTAECIKQGIISGFSQKVEINELDALKGFFYLNWDYCTNLMNNQVFTQKWFHDEIPDTYIIPIEHAAEIMMDEIISNHKPGTTNIFITHDWNIFCLKSLYYDRYDQMEVPGYLEGIIVDNNRKMKQIFKKALFAGDSAPVSSPNTD